MRIPASLLNDLGNASREGAVSAALGARVKMERAISTPSQLQAIVEALNGPVQHREDSINGSWSFLLPTAEFQTTDSTVGLWHCDDASGAVAADASDNGNDLDLTDVSWTTGEFDGGLSFNGSSSVAEVTLSHTEIVQDFLYFAAWANPTSGPIFTWDGVMEVYIDSGALCVDIEGETYTGPALGAGWQLLHCQFFAGTVYVAVDDIVWAFTHTGTSLTIAAYDIQIGQRDAAFYSGLLDEVRLVTDVILQDDWGRRYNMAHPRSVLYCMFNRGYGLLEHHADFLGPTVTLSGVTWTTGYDGQAISLDGIDDYVVFTPSAATTPDELTIHFVIRFDTLDACTLLDQTSGLNLAFDGTHLVSALQGVGSPSTQVGPLAIAVNTWYDVALVWNGATKAVWLNGRKTGEIAATGTGSIPATPVYIGRTVAGTGSFAGDIDMLQITRTVLKPQNRPISRFIVGKHGFEVGEDWAIME